MRTLALLGISVLSGCLGGTDDPSGPVDNVWKMFPFDGQRTWEYINVDDTVTWTLVGTMQSDQPILKDGLNVYTIDYTKHCVGTDSDCVEGELVRTVAWSSDPVDGVHIHRWEQDGAPLAFEPPVKLAGSDMATGEPTETATTGALWTSELVDLEECPVYLTVVDWPLCGRFHLTGEGVGLPGDYWAVRSAGIVAMELTDGMPRWELLATDCTPDEGCDGVW